MVAPASCLLRQSPRACAAALRLSRAGWELEMNVRGCHPAPGPGPSCHKPLLLWLQPEQRGGWPFPGACRRGHAPCTGLMPQHHPGFAVLAPGTSMPLALCFPLETKTLQGTHHHLPEVPGELEEPQPRSEGGHASSLNQVASGAQQEGQGLARVSLGNRHRERRPLSALTPEKQHPSPPSRAQDSQRGRGLRQLG